jgi:hypothetical protein
VVSVSHVVLGALSARDLILINVLNVTAPICGISTNAWRAVPQTLTESSTTRTARVVHQLVQHVMVHSVMTASRVDRHSTCLWAHVSQHHSVQSSLTQRTVTWSVSRVICYAPHVQHQTLTSARAASTHSTCSRVSACYHVPQVTILIV